MRLGDAGLERLLRYRHQPDHVRIGYAHHDRQRGVSVEPIDQHTDINADNIAHGDTARPGNAVHHFFVHRNAHRARIPPVSQKRAPHPLPPHEFAGLIIERLRRDPGTYPRGQRLANRPRAPSSHAHFGNVLGTLDNDHGRRFMMSATVSSRGPDESTRCNTPRFA